MTIQANHINEDWMSVNLSDIDFSVRTSNCLAQMGVTTLGDLSRISDSDLLRQPNFGIKCLNEVKTLLSSAEHLLDFRSMNNFMLSNLLQPIQVLQLTVRAKNVVTDLGFELIGELIQLKEIDLLRRPNCGKTTIVNIRKELDKIGLSLGTTIVNWPKEDELLLILHQRALELDVQDSIEHAQVLEKSSQNRVSKLKMESIEAIESYEYLEEELCAAVRMSVKHSEYPIIMRRTGWDGDEVLTLEELGSNPASSGRSKSVSRERIRQIESKGFKNIQSRSWTMPILKRAISLISGNAPLAVDCIQELLEKHQVSRCGLGFESVDAAVEAFGEKWGLVGRSIEGDMYLFAPSEVDLVAPIWNLMAKEAIDKDFVVIDELEGVAEKMGVDSLDIVSLGVSKIEHLEWLIEDAGVYWSRERNKRGWNKIINICRKILTIAPDISLERLSLAVKRARTITYVPSSDVLLNMLRSTGDFHITNGIVSRGDEFKSGCISTSDKLMIDAVKNVGTVTTFSELRDFLVRQRVPINHAQQLIHFTPFWITSSRGKYRFIANKSQLEEISQNLMQWNRDGQKIHECLVEIVISPRHLMTGSHRIQENLVEVGQWILKDEMGNEIGTVNVTSSKIQGLSILSQAGIEVGSFVIIDFSDQNFSATVYI